MNELLKKIEIEITSLFHLETSGHDIFHLKRVLHLALVIQEREMGDRLVIGVAALLHDVHRIIQKQTGKFCSPKDSLPRVKEILDKVDISGDKKALILHCIEFHEEYSFSEQGKTAVDVETLIIQDADNLDSTGAIGVARAFMFGGANNIPMWLPEIPFEREHFDEGITDVSEIHHFYSKLLKLKDNMNTETAKRIAEDRHRFLEQFLAEFFSEWEGRI